MGIKVPDDDSVSERELFRRIADEIDREKREITERYARQSWMNPADAIAKLATGEIEWAELQQTIDRYYLPRPLFEDGEPAQFGDMFVRDFGRDAKIDSLSYTKGNFDYVNVNGYERHDFAHRLKRPNPQVLDADGVQIEVGDVLYRTTDDMKAVVAKLEKGYFVDDEGAGFNPSYFTHREPDTIEKVLDDIDAFIDILHDKRVTNLKPLDEWRERIAALVELDGRDA